MTEQRRIRGGNLLARAFHEKGIEHVFTLAGGFCNPALEGFMECQMPVINCPHEQIAGHLADGHARITRKPVVCLVGPEGFANAVPAMMEAWGERSPVIFVTGSSTLKRQGAGGFKEIDDVSIAAPLTKHSVSVTDGTRIREFVDRAYKMAINGYPGPVHLSVPVDIMFSSFDESAGREERPFDQTPKAPPRAWPDPGALGPLLAEQGKPRNEPTRPENRADGEMHRLGRFLGKPHDFLADLIESAGQDPAQGPALFGQDDLSGFPDEKRATPIALELAYLVADGGRRYAQFPRGILETQEPRGGLEGPQCVEGQELSAHLSSHRYVNISKKSFVYNAPNSRLSETVNP